MTIVFISYFFYPSQIVGAKRVSFWVRELEKNYKDITPVVITASPFNPDEKITENQYYVKPAKKGFSTYLIEDEGAQWKSELRKFLSTFEIEGPLAFVISGSPFMHFSLTGYIKKKFSCKVILDFRDPFAINPRFRNSTLKKWVKQFLEGNFIRQADTVLTVNEVCLSLLTGYKQMPEKFHVIPNGYDPYTFESLNEKSVNKKSDYFQLVYAGKYYPEALPYNLWEAISKLNGIGKDIVYKHFGTPLTDESEKKYPFIVEMGMQDYKVVISELVQSDVALVHTEGDPFQSTTKIYDYIGAEIPILIITDGEKKTGTLNEITADYPKVKWSFNNVSEIKQCLIELMEDKSEFSYPEKSRFSRRHGLEELLKIIRG